MDYGTAITDSIDYTKDALWGKWVRWLIFIICSLPFALFPFVIDAKEVFSSTEIRWDLIHWDQLAAIFIAGFLLSFIVSGYITRIYRGTKPAPEFDSWYSLYLDGIKLAVVSFIWYSPMIIVIIVLLGIATLGMASGGNMTSVGLVLGLMLLSIVIEMILLVIILLFSTLGMIRFARTGSIREGIRFSKISETISTIGAGTYIIALVVLMACGFIFYIVISVVDLIPYAGWVIHMVITPVFMIFSARYMSLIYDLGEPQPAAQLP